MLTLPGREALAERAIASTAPYRDHIELTVIEGTPDRHMGRNRARAYRIGTNPYVACLDDDDYLLGPLDEALDLLEARPGLAGVYYDDVQVDTAGAVLRPGYTVGSGPWSPVQQLHTPPHHICVMRRAAVLSALATLATFPVFDLRVLHALILEHGDLRHIDSVRYAWVQHEGQHHKSVRGWREAHQRAVDFARPLVVAAHHKGLKPSPAKRRAERRRQGFTPTRVGR